MKFFSLRNNVSYPVPETVLHPNIAKYWNILILKEQWGRAIWRLLRNFTEIFRRHVTYNNTKNHKKAGLHPFSEKHILGKTNEGVNLWLKLPYPALPRPPHSRPFSLTKVTLGTFVDSDYFTSYLLTKETVNKRNCMKTRWRNFLRKRNAVEFVRSILESPH